MHSRLLKGDSRLEACLVSDPAHVTSGSSGDFVAKIQTALVTTDGASIAATERSTKRYGPTTTQAVLKYKRNPARNILNYAGQFDAIVGKKTIASLDAEMVTKESTPPTPANRDLAMVNTANIRRLEALAKTEKLLNQLKKDFEPGVPDLNDPVVKGLERQLFIGPNSSFWTLTNAFLAMVVRIGRSRPTSLWIGPIPTLPTWIHHWISQRVLRQVPRSLPLRRTTTAARR
ncbi:MAG: hypothetical protein M3Y24_08710 [Acidobacteriota bacterium]|nr:hypothetical protein [Acidobacteriota bacterium]